MYRTADESNKINILTTLREMTGPDGWVDIDTLNEEHDDITKTTIYRNLKALRDEGLVEKFGSEKSGLYRYSSP